MITDLQGRDMNEPITVGQIWQIMADLGEANGNTKLAEALIGRPAYTLDDLIERTGLRREQVEERLNAGVIPQPVTVDSEHNRPRDEDGMQRVDAVLENKSMFDGDSTKAEDPAELAYRQEAQYTHAQAAEIRVCSTKTIDRYIQRGLIREIKFTQRRIRFEEAEIIRFAREGVAV